MTRYVYFAPLVILVVLATYFAVGLTQNPHDLPSVLLDRPVPAFDMPAIAGLEKGLNSSELKGRVVLLNVFASWCPSCRVEHPTLLELSKRNAIVIYGLDWKDERGAGARWLDELGNPYLQIGDDMQGRVAIDLGVTGAPETFVIDKAGRIRYKQIGPVTDEVWSQVLEPLVRKLEAES